jgi:hypothetical protein
MFWLWAGVSEASPLTLEAILEPLKTESSGILHFEESRTPKGLKTPLRTTGELQFIPPDRLIRRSLSPESAEYLIEGGMVSITDPSREESIRFDLAELPELEHFATALRALLIGDSALLRSHFAITLSGDISRWHLDLRPLDAEPTETESLRIEGQNGRLSEILLIDRIGTSSQIKLSRP